MKKLENRTIQLLIGLLLGDGHISRSGEKSFITMEQGIRHEKYIKHLYSLLESMNIPLHPIKYYSRSDRRYATINESVYFKSHNLESLNLLADMFIPNGIKVIPSDIKQWLTPISLAHWICGDGQLVKKGGITLCTDNYTSEEIDLLMSGLKEVFNAKCSIHIKKGRNNSQYKRIYINKESFDQIKPSILKHVHKSFLYKLHK